MIKNKLFEYDEDTEEDEEEFGWDDLDSFNDTMSDFEDKWGVFMSETHQNGHMGTVYLHRIHDELVVMVGVNGDRPSTREDITPPRTLTTEPKVFLEGLIAQLPESAVVPIHPLIPHVKYAGSPRHGYVMAIDSQYEGDLVRLINPPA